MFSGLSVPPIYLIILPMSKIVRDLFPVLNLFKRNVPERNRENSYLNDGLSTNKSYKRPGSYN